MKKGYFENLTETQKNNIATINKIMIERGITNPFTRTAILSVASKESNFVPQTEKGYKTTSNDRIRSIFSSTRKLTDEQLTNLKQDEKEFFNFIYGGKYGNSSSEGWLYRGRAYNQLTFKDNYKSIGNRLGIDLVSNPDRANDPVIAAKIMIDYFIREFETAKKLGILSQYNTTDINSFKTAPDSLKAVYQANAGWNKKGHDNTGGYEAAKDRYTGFAEFIGEHKVMIGGGLFFFLATTLFIIYKIKKRKK